jgi:putative hemolysin
MDDPSSLTTVGGLLAVIVLVLTNGFFVAAEFSLVSVRRSRVGQLMAEEHPLAPAVHRATRQLDLYLAATQLGITMASIGLGWIGEPTLAKLIKPVFHFLPDAWEVVGTEALAIALAFGLVTVLHIVLGELAPKSLALQRTESTALIVARPLGLFLMVFRPAILVLNSMGNHTLRLFRLEPAGGEGSVHSTQELQLLVAASRGAGLVGEETEKIVERAFKFDDLTARQVMVPRVDIVSVSMDVCPEEALAVAVKSHHRTHLPVHTGTLDDIVGVANVLDLLTACADASHKTLEEVMRPALQVPETIPADVLLSRMRTEGTQVAILVDEYGGTEGLVTMHDLVEQLVGPVLETSEEEQSPMEVLADGSASLSGRAAISVVNERFGLRLPNGETDTVGGFMLARLGRMPVPGDEVTFDGCLFRVESLDGRRIEWISLVNMAASV